MVALNTKGEIKRGDVFYVDLTGIEQSIGFEQKGKRPVLVIQNDVGNHHAPTTIVAILTSKIKRNLPTHVVISDFDGLPSTSAVCLEQIKTIDKTRLESYKGNIGESKMQEIEKAIMVSLGVSKNVLANEILDNAYKEGKKDMDYFIMKQFLMVKKQIGYS